jgi:hypothetical protein
MKDKIPGVSSIALVFIAFGIAAYQLLQYSILLGLLFIVFTPAVFLNVMYQYCRKCPHVKSKTCRHVIIGAITGKLFGSIESSAYTRREILLMLIPLCALVIFPQYWLFQNIPLLIAFWVLMVLAVLIVLTGVCRTCENNNCAMCPNKKNNND